MTVRHDHVKGSPCIVDGCDKPSVNSRGWCPGHYQRWRLGKDVGGPLRSKRLNGAPVLLCSMVGCAKPQHDRGWCRKHYNAWRRHGDPGYVRPKKPKTSTPAPGARGHHIGVSGAVRSFDPRLERNRHSQAGSRTEKLGGQSFTISVKDMRRLALSPCAACGSRQRGTLEHLIPVSRGGTHGIGNLTTLCWSCNSSKNDQTWMEWRMRREGWR